MSEPRDAKKEEGQQRQSTGILSRLEEAGYTESELSIAGPLPEENAVVMPDTEYSPASSRRGNTPVSGQVSIASAVYRGVIEHGRRYQTTREGDYWGPSDEKQFESMQIGHLVNLLLESQAPNPLFLSPISEDAKNILDLGCGDGQWAIDVADRFPDITVHGVDLYPPPQEWVPPNCILEVDDISKEWTWSLKFDLVHLRFMLGAFSRSEWATVYQHCYDNLVPGGWIEHVEPSINFQCDDGTLPPNSALADWGPIFTKCGDKSGRPLSHFEVMEQDIRNAGFVNIHVKSAKIPIGPWAKHPLLKELGRLRLQEHLNGMEGYALHLLTRFGEPTPWSSDRVHGYLAQVRQELTGERWHAYGMYRRVWAQKPFENTGRSSDEGAPAKRQRV